MLARSAAKLVDNKTVHLSPALGPTCSGVFARHGVGWRAFGEKKGLFGAGRFRLGSWRGCTAPGIPGCRDDVYPGSWDAGMMCAQDRRMLCAWDAGPMSLSPAQRRIILSMPRGPPWASLQGCSRYTLVWAPGSPHQGVWCGMGLHSTKPTPHPKRTKPSLPHTPSLEPGGYRMPCSIHFIILSLGSWAALVMVETWI